MDKRARLSLFYERLSAAPAASTHDEALKLLCDTLNGVEDEHSNSVFNPDNWETDGRMYPPEVDNAFAVDGFSQVVRYRSARHIRLLAELVLLRLKISRQVLWNSPS